MSDETQSLYQLIGHERLQQTVNLFYTSVLKDPLLQPLFGDGHPTHVEHLTAFLAEVFGGPPRYTDELGGFATILKAHRGLNITDEQRARFIELFDMAMVRTGLGNDDTIRMTLNEYLSFGTEVAQINSFATTDAELHPCQEVPRWP